MEIVKAVQTPVELNIGFTNGTDERMMPLPTSAGT
jgi:hypothetical protein